MRVGEWTNFTCGVHCSQSEYITWFVHVNGSTIPLFEGAVSGLKVQNYPQSSLCSMSHALKKETHSIALMLNHNLDLPLMIYCAVISVCKRNMPGCTTHSCYSQNTYLDIEGSYKCNKNLMQNALKCWIECMTLIWYAQCRINTIQQSHTNSDEYCIANN